MMYVLKQALKCNCTCITWLIPYLVKISVDYFGLMPVIFNFIINFFPIIRKKYYISCLSPRFYIFIAQYHMCHVTCSYSDCIVLQCDFYKETTIEIWVFVWTYMHLCVLVQCAHMFYKHVSIEKMKKKREKDKL